MQAVVQEVQQAHHHPGQHAPVDARRGQQRDREGDAGGGSLDRRDAPELAEGCGPDQVHHRHHHHRRQHGAWHMEQHGRQEQQRRQHKPMLP
jgi:hypothetical protein